MIKGLAITPPVIGRISIGRLVQKNDKVIIVTYGQLPQEEARKWSPTVVLLDDRNEIKRAA